MTAPAIHAARSSSGRDLREDLKRAFACHARGSFNEAEQIGRGILVLDPSNAMALHLVGEIALRRGNLGEAIDFTGRAIKSQPRFAEAHNTLGCALRLAGRLDEAAAHFRKAIRIKPDFVEPYNGLGGLLIGAQRYDEAAIVLRKALRLDPSHVNALNNLGLALSKLARFDEAVETLERAVALRPDFAIAQTNLGNAYRALDQTERAASAHARAVALDPNIADYQLNYGNSLRERGDVAGAIAAFRRAIALSPESVAAHNNLGGALLSCEQWDEGWREFEWRWRLPENAPLRTRYRLPLWAGEPLQGRHLLLWGEQGIGDVLLFATMLPDLLQTGARLSLELDPRLVPLFARTFPALAVHPWGAVPAAPPCDLQANLGRLGLFLRSSTASFAHTKPYLRPDPARVARFKARYAQLGQGPTIGLSWRSTSASHRRKSLALDQFRPLLAALPHATFIALQYGDTHAERARLHAETGVTLHHDDSFDNWTDLDGLAAQIAALDQVVTVSNLNAHLAGALGVPAHVLLTANVLWYWPHNKQACQWYRSVKLWRTASTESPSDLLAAVARQLAGV